MIQQEDKASPKNVGKASPKDVNQIKHGQIKEVNFTIAFFKNG